MATATNNQTCTCGQKCYADNFPSEPCWGKVEVTPSRDKEVYIHYCSGHGYPGQRQYQPEPAMELTYAIP